MWIVGVDTAYYPEVLEFETYEEAKKFYDAYNVSPEYETVYIADVKDWKGRKVSE